MRCGEVLALKRNDIDFKNNIIHVKRSLTRDLKDKVKLGDSTKTYNGIRDIPLSKFLKDKLKHNMNINFLFTLPNGDFITPSTINSHCKRIAKDAGILLCDYKIHRNGKVINLKSSEMTTHQIRHTYRHSLYRKWNVCGSSPKNTWSSFYRRYFRYLYFCI